MGRRHGRAVVTAALRIATHNVWGMRGDWEQRLQVLRRGYEQLAADVVTLQETILDDDVDQARSIPATVTTSSSNARESLTGRA